MAKKVFIPLVNHADDIIGSGEKLDVHKKGLLHRAFSIFIFNEKGEVLLQQRALEKYHSPGEWTNTCCSHPYINEPMHEAAKRRLNEEMGFTCDLNYQFKFIYKASFSNGLTEHELDHVFTGSYNGQVEINTEEVAASKWMKPKDILNDIEKNPQDYTYWFKHLLDNHSKELFGMK